MPSSTVDLLPFDIWHQIASRLGVPDYVNLSLTNKKLYHLLQSELTARNSVQTFIAHAAETKLASNGHITYRQALGRVFDIQEAWASAQPYSAALIAYGETFVFNQGVLCYLDHGEIRALNVHASARVESIVNVKAILRKVVSGGHLDFEKVKFTLLHYNGGIVSCLCEIDQRRSSWLIAIDVGVDVKCDADRIRLARRLESTRRLFVRQNNEYLFYGTHSVLASHGHHEWIIQGVNLRTGHKLTDRGVQLENFVGSDIGSALCFEIHDGYFYAVSNQTGFEDEEIDWTSYYVCLRFPLSDPGNPKKLEWRRIWRRQHREGPINDTWTDISLRVDDSTKELLIVECRREWLLGGSENTRTYYTQPLNCFDKDPEEVSDGLPDADSQSDEEADDSDSDSVPPFSSGLPEYFPASFLPDDPLTSTLDEYSKPNYEPAKKRLRRHYHAEYPPGEIPSAPRRDFIFSKTKYRTYNHSTSSFLDLVNDPAPTTSFMNQPDRLRLRIGSRKRKCPIDEEGEEGNPGFLYRPEYTDDRGRPLELSDERFESRGINLWPPHDAPEELLSLLCPPKRCGRIEAASDERSLVYSTDPDPSSLEGRCRRPIIFITFDPTIRLANLRRLSMQVPSTRSNEPTEIDRRDIRIDKGKRRVVTLEPEPEPEFEPQAETEVQSRRSTAFSQSSCTNGIIERQVTEEMQGKGEVAASLPWFRTEPAMYLRINRAYWLR